MGVNGKMERSHTSHIASAAADLSFSPTLPRAGIVCYKSKAIRRNRVRSNDLLIFKEAGVHGEGSGLDGMCQEGTVNELPGHNASSEDQRSTTHINDDQDEHDFDTLFFVQTQAFAVSKGGTVAAGLHPSGDGSLCLVTAASINRRGTRSPDRIGKLRYDISS